ncbi:hypothetical protein ABZ570_29100 [Micromonospora sp. NPDC007271]|uniref:hypothetical protein n=1 Tax=Micromonospora sp. NPDC007271 TaxID=3154587 RepID=UPI003402394D
MVVFGGEDVGQRVDGLLAAHGDDGVAGVEDEVAAAGDVADDAGTLTADGGRGVADADARQPVVRFSRGPPARFGVGRRRPSAPV